MRYRRLLPAVVLALSGCSVIIDQSSFFPQASPPPETSLAAPSGYSLDEAMIALPGLGRVHAVRLDNPASEATIVYAGGNASFVSGQSDRAAALAGATNADIVLYDYPGRGGTDIPPTMDAAIAFGPSFMDALRAKGWARCSSTASRSAAARQQVWRARPARRVSSSRPARPTSRRSGAISCPG